MEENEADETKMAEVSNMNILNRRLGMLCLIRRTRSLWSSTHFPKSK